MAVEQVREVFKQLRGLDKDPDDSTTAAQNDKLKRSSRKLDEFDIRNEAVAILIRLKAAKQPPLLDVPRRGAIFEWTNLFEDHVSQYTGVPEADMVPRREAVLNLQAAEMWREAECLAFGSSSHSMAQLKQLPELQQIIAHTSIDAIHACAGNMLHLVVGFLAQQERLKAAEEYGTERTPSDAERFALNEKVVTQYANGESGKDASLLQLLTPALRLCLAAEVAVGMLCPGQPAPPDTPEHAAALQMFVAEAYNHVEAELCDHPNHGRPPLNIPRAVHDMWDHKQTLKQQQRGQQQQREQQQEQQLPLPKITEVASWDLAPHMDLHMQLPPHQQLQLLCELLALQQQQQQQQQEEGAKPASTAAAAAAAATGEVPYSVHNMQVKQQEVLTDLLEYWLQSAAVHDAAASCLAHGSGSSSSDDVANEYVAAVLEAASKASNGMQQAVAAAGKECSQTNTQQQQGQQQQQQGFVVSSDDEEVSDSSSSSDDGSISSSSSDDDGSSSNGASAGVQHRQHCTDPLMLLANNLIIKFIQDQYQAGTDNFDPAWQQQYSPDSSSGPAWQHAVPLQVLVLTTHLQKLQHWLQALRRDPEKQFAQHAADVSSCSNCSSSNDVATEHERAPQANSTQSSVSVDVAQHIVGLVHSIRQFTAANKKMRITAAAAASAAPESNTARIGADGKSHNSICSTASYGMAPETFFSAAGPLASGIWGFVEPTGAGIWEPVNPNPIAEQHQHLNKAACRRQQSPDHQASQSHIASQVQPDCQAQPDHQAQVQVACQAQVLQHQAWHVLIGSYVWQQLMDTVNMYWQGKLPHFHQRYLKYLLEMTFYHPQLTRLERRKAEKLVSSAKELGVRIPHHVAMAVAASGDVLADWLVKERQQIVHAMGIAPPNASLKSHDKQLRKQCLKRQLEEADITVDGLSDCDSDDDAEAGEDSWDFTATASEAALPAGLQVANGQSEANHAVHSQSNAVCSQPEVQVGRGGQAGSLSAAAVSGPGVNSETGSSSVVAGASGHHPDSQAGSSAAAGAAGHGPDSQAGSSSPAGAAGHRPDSQAGSSSPAGAAGHGPDSQAGSPSADTDRQDWSERAAVGQARHAVRQLGSCIAQQFSPLYQWHMQWSAQYKQQTEAAKKWWESKERINLARSGAKGKKPKSCADPANAQPNSSANGSSSDSRQWQKGMYDYNPHCPVCQQELQQKQQLPDSSGSSSTIYSQPPVPYSDPFMWRRLLWQLLGKLSPQAQAFYAQYLAMCAHCSDNKLWQWVRRSIFHSLWISPSGDVIEQQLSCPSLASQLGNMKRGKRLLQYAHALNEGFVANYKPAGPLLAQQLLLALSPLHQQLLPRPETAFLCPSSFSAAIGKALQQQLFSQQGLLDTFQHHSTQLHMWHVWWHLGIRRYAAMQQQQRPATPAEADCAYLDPDARLYATGFATSQLTGALPISSNLHMLKLLIPGGTSVNHDTEGRSHHSDGSSNNSSSRSSLVMAANSSSAAAVHAALQVLHQIRTVLTVQKATPLQSSDSTPSSSSGGGGDSSNTDQSLDQAAKAKALQLIKAWNAKVRLSDEAVLQYATLYPGDNLLDSAIVRQQQQRLLSTEAGPDVAQLYMQNGTMTSQAAANRYKIWLHHRRMQQLQPSSDIEQVALHPPSAMEAMCEPSLWVVWQLKLLGRLWCCHYCDRQFDADEWDESAVFCSRCGLSSYCSSECLAKDATDHALMCRQLRQAHWRYWGPPCNCEVLQLKCRHKQLGAFPRLLQLLQTDEAGPRPWGYSGAAVAALKEQVLPSELFTQELGRAFAPVLDAMLSANRTSTYEHNPFANPWAPYKS